MNLSKIYLLKLKKMPIFQQLQLEEALLRADQRNWCIMNEGSSQAIVMGISGQFDSLINRPLIQYKPVPVIRRFSGGGTVFIDEHTHFVTFICNSVEVGISCFPDKVLKWTASLYQPIFAEAGFRLLENDYVLGNRKFGGNAQYMRKDRWLHHSSLLWDYHPHNMEYLLIPSKTPSYRKRRGHSDFLCRLKDHFQKETFEGKLEQQLHERFQVEEMKFGEIEDVLQRPHRKATTLVEIKNR